jgi:CheY-like chemotaxis protein
MGDAQRLQQVLWNVLGNAIKFTKSGGDVTVASDNPDAKTLRIRVTDTGIGIAPEHLPYIFEAFERGEAVHRYEYTGLGLGLAIARSLTEKMSGTIKAHSAGAGQGTTLTITFPLAPAAAKLPVQQVAPTIRKAESVCAHKVERVLLVEDHTATAEILSRLIARDGAEVAVARSMDEALAVARGGQFDLILSDIGLPGGTGHDLLRTLRAEGNTTPAIAISGYGMTSDIAASRAAGFCAHLTKPVDFDQLRNAISDVVASR